MARIALVLTAAIVMATGSAAAQTLETLDLAAHDIVDLSHAYDQHTVYWPTERHHYERETLAYGDTDEGYFYAAYRFCTAEHGGTHMDAPIHFFADRHTTEAVPLDQLIGPGVVIDVSAQAAADRTYRLTVADVTAFEARHGRVPAGAIVLLRTDWSRHWPDVKAYLGDDTPGDASKLAFPSFGVEAARLLIEERGVAVLGVDTASTDYGPSTDFPVHRLAGRHNIPGLENLTNLDRLPPTGATIFALPMKIAGGSGGPTRVIALTPR